MFLLKDSKTQFISGSWRESASIRTIPVVNPVTMQPVCHVAAGCPEDAYLAIDAAKSAAPLWAQTSLAVRLEYIERILNYLKHTKRIITRLEVEELGAPISYARRVLVDEPLKLFQLTIDKARIFPFETRTATYTYRAEPLGVVLAVTPWNFPLGGIVSHVVSALLMGNTVVLKPSHQAPLVAMLFARATQMAALPNGVFNLINGAGKNYSDAVFSHPDVGLVSYAGSTSVGQRIASLEGAQFVPTHLMCGGKSPAVWIPGLPSYRKACCDLFDSVFLNAGQNRAALSRLYIHESMIEDVKVLMKEIIECYPVGQPNDPKTVVGPLVDSNNYSRVRRLMIEAVNDGAELFAGGIPLEQPQKGFFVKPTIFFNVNSRMHLVREDIMGPVLSVLTYKTLDEAVSRANLTPYGMCAAVTGPEKDAAYVASRIEAGNVFINTMPDFMADRVVGFKQSGYGRESGSDICRPYIRFKCIYEG